VIVEIDGEPVETVEDLYAALRGHEPGDEVQLTVDRGGAEQRIAVTLAERPAESP
jgi:putative serine protease PepD